MRNTMNAGDRALVAVTPLSSLLPSFVYLAPFLNLSISLCSAMFIPSDHSIRLAISLYSGTS